MSLWRESCAATYGLEHVQFREILERVGRRKISAWRLKRQLPQQQVNYFAASGSPTWYWREPAQTATRAHGNIFFPSTASR